MNSEKCILAVALAAAFVTQAPLGQDLQNTTAIPESAAASSPLYVDGNAPALLPAGGAIRVYKDSDAWFGENRDHNTLLALGRVLGTDYFIHPLADLFNPIPAHTAVVLLSSNGVGLLTAVNAQNAPAAQANLEAFVKAGGVLIVDMGDNVTNGGYLAPGSSGTPDYIFPSPCEDATLAPAALGSDGLLGTADDHPLVLGPDGLPGTADDLDNFNIDLSLSCYVAHGNLQTGINLPADASILMTARFNGLPEPILAEYCLDSGLVILDTITKEFSGHQGPGGTGTVPTFFLTNLFDYALSGQATRQCIQPVDIDIKFCSNPNAFNCKKKGVLPVTVFGSEDAAVTDIDLESLRLCRADDPTQCTGPPRTFSFDDRGDPTTDRGASSCGSVNPDGFLDLDVGFEAQQVAPLIGCMNLSKKDISVTLILTGQLNSGRPIGSIAVNSVGIDQLLIQNR